MNAHPPDERLLQQFAAEVGTIAPRPHHTPLLALARRLLPQFEFRHVASRRGWHRPGGLVRADGGRVSDSLALWLEDALAACNGDLQGLLERHAETGLLVTRLQGSVHIFTAPYGATPDAFLQLEVEELQEVVERPLVDPQYVPADAVELLDPPAYSHLTPIPLGHPYYRFRRLTDMQRITGGLDPARGDAPLSRFMREWQASSAGARTRLCAHWYFDLREHLDRYRNLCLIATPVACRTRELKGFHWVPQARGVALAQQLQSFDRAAGHAAAWYFHLVAGGLTPAEVAETVAHDLAAGYRYLPECEVRLLEGWLASPYTLGPRAAS